MSWPQNTITVPVQIDLYVDYINTFNIKNYIDTMTIHTISIIHTSSHKLKLTQTQAEMDINLALPLLLSVHRVILVQGNPPATWDSMVCISSATNEIVLQWT